MDVYTPRTTLRGGPNSDGCATAGSGILRRAGGRTRSLETARIGCVDHWEEADPTTQSVGGVVRPSRRSTSSHRRVRFDCGLRLRWAGCGELRSGGCTAIHSICGLMPRPIRSATARGNRCRRPHLKAGTRETLHGSSWRRYRVDRRVRHMGGVVPPESRRGGRGGRRWKSEVVVASMQEQQRPGSAPTANGRAKHVATSAVVRLFPSRPPFVLDEHADR